MPDPNVAELIRDTGFLYWNPVSRSNLGTQLGYLKDGISFYPNYTVVPVTAETSGTIPQMYIYSGLTAVVDAKIMNINQYSLQRGLLQTVVGLAATVPGAPFTGKDLVSGTTAGSLIFVPNNSTSHPCFYSSSCFGYLNGGLEYDRGILMSVPVRFYCASFMLGLLTEILGA